ncbi:expressed unknown protein [Seminavis robusta]|uniref:Fungal lipase-type domain-containing protein n=1 Tax=Seminavis robusta TaxID=568900 RepID=A0A9N8DCU1_9STRA|nr:expressed unknown protein [Seminavis robusta]|eukprot:Sro18_g012960.1 n/a (358) ;mRNA; r:109155-110228
MVGYKKLAVVLLSLLGLDAVLASSDVKEDSTKEEGGGLRRNRQYRRRNERSCPRVPANRVDAALDASTLDVIADASNLVQLPPRTSPDTLKEQNQVAFDMFNVYRDLDDRVVVAKSKTNGACHLAFGVPGGTPFDNLQNLNPFTTQIGDCAVRTGYVMGYNMSKADEFHLELQSCLASCVGEDTCPLIISGYSQGGAIAIVAAIDLVEYSPITVTFGATAAIVNPQHTLSFLRDDTYQCTDFVPERHYQFVNMVDGKYDCVALGVNPFSATHSGRLLLLDENTDHFVGSPGVFQVADDSRREPSSNRAHRPDLYKERMEKLLRGGCSVLPVGKWETAHDCNYNDECSSGLCQDNACT